MSALAAELGFDETSQGKAALVVTEAASNLVKHSGGGELILEGVALRPGRCMPGNTRLSTRDEE